MDPWRFVGLLALTVCASTTAVSAQRLTWDLDEYTTAEFTRTTTSTSKIVDPPSKKPVEEIEGVVKNMRKRSPQVNLIPNPLFEKARRAFPVSWGKKLYRGTAKHTFAKEGGKTGKRCVTIYSKAGADATWHCNVVVKANTRYRLSGWVKTKDIGRGTGAQINVHQLGGSVSTPTVRGTVGWKEVRVEFDSGKHTALRINCMLGGFYQTRGQAWFDDIVLVRIPRFGASKPRNKVDAALFRGARRSTLLRGKDLDPRDQYLKTPPRDLRDVASHLAFDLRHKSGVKLKKQALVIAGVAPSWLEVSFMSLTTEGTEGTQRILARIRPTREARKSRKPKKSKKSKKSKKPKKLQLIVTGDIVVTRIIRDRKLVSFTTELRLDVEVPKNWRGLPGVRRCAVDIRESWEHQRTDLPEGGIFQARVDQAIRNGARYLRGERAGNGGRLALVVLTLIKAGENRRDPLMKQLLTRLRKSVLRRTYDCAVGIMALEALYAPADERDLLMSGRIAEPIARSLSPGDLAIMQRWTDQLRKNLDTRVQSGYLQRWGYTRAARFDNSNTQYAMLGLYTASLCGVKIPATVWFASANHWLACQSGPTRGKAGGAVSLDLISYREAKENEKKKRRTVTRSAGVRPRGWGYTTKNRGVSGSMTTAGITGLVICGAALRASKKGTVQLRAKMNLAIQQGFAWLARNFSVTNNPGGNQRWHYYYLYGLERACELNGTKLLNGRRWYFEGASLLLNQQSKDGVWKNIEDTCFAILFLKKAAPPVMTGPR
jgi:hypothetical protein